MLALGCEAHAQDGGITKVPQQPVQDLSLTTKDNVQIACRYLPGNQGKNTIPIIMLHGWWGPVGEGAGKDLLPLARRLQQAGHAVAVPDLRGHGRSTAFDNSEEGAIDIDRSRFRPHDFRDMMLDVEAVRSFLAEQNNKSQLNLDLLCLIGFEMGSVVALNWIHYDWMVPSFPRLKQGQDVKAFVLVSPEQSFKGFAVRPALANQTIRSDLSAMIVYGKQDPMSDEGRRLYNTLRRSRRALPAGVGDEEANRLQDLFLLELDTRLRGSKLIDVPTLNIERAIIDFIERRLVSQRASAPWRNRSLNN